MLLSQRKVTLLLVIYLGLVTCSLSFRAAWPSMFRPKAASMSSSRRTIIEMKQGIVETKQRNAYKTDSLLEGKVSVHRAKDLLAEVRGLMSPKVAIAPKPEVDEKQSKLTKEEEKTWEAVRLSTGAFRKSAELGKRFTVQRAKELLNEIQSVADKYVPATQEPTRAAASSAGADAATVHAAKSVAPTAAATATLPAVQQSTATTDPPPSSLSSDRLSQAQSLLADVRSLVKQQKLRSPDASPASAPSPSSSSLSSSSVADDSSGVCRAVGNASLTSGSKEPWEEDAPLSVLDEMRLQRRMQAAPQRPPSPAPSAVPSPSAVSSSSSSSSSSSAASPSPGIRQGAAPTGPGLVLMGLLGSVVTGGALASVLTGADVNEVGVNLAVLLAGIALASSKPRGE